MESYLEVSWLSNFLILLNASTLAFYLGGKPCTFRYLVLYSAVIPLAAGLLFHPYEWLWMMLIEGCFFVLIYRYAWKNWLLMMAHRMLCSVSAHLWYGGSFHLGVYFVPADQIPIALWVIFTFTWLGMFCHWKYELTQQSFIYPLEIRTTKEVLRLKGYLDSGNFMMQDGLPVLLLDARYETYFNHSRIKWVMMNTAQGTSRIACYEANARIAKNGYHRILVHFRAPLKLPLGAHALLSIHMMTQE